MKREIKFRAWDKKRQMVLLIEVIDFDERWVGYGEKAEWERADFDDLELMQYTGLKDVNGVEIYEGDVLKYTNNDGRDDLQCVKFEHGVYYLENGLILYLVSQFSEVVGNIYEGVCSNSFPNCADDPFSDKAFWRRCMTISAEEFMDGQDKYNASLEYEDMRKNDEDNKLQ